MLGPIGGILIADYFVYRRTETESAGALSNGRRISVTRGGFSIVALVALGIGDAAELAGFLATVKVLPKESVAPIFMSVYNYAWFVGFAVAFVVYLAARKLAPHPSRFGAETAQLT